MAAKKSSQVSTVLRSIPAASTMSDRYASSTGCTSCGSPKIRPREVTGPNDGGLISSSRPSSRSRSVRSRKPTDSSGPVNTRPTTARSTSIRSAVGNPPKKPDIIRRSIAATLINCMSSGRSIPPSACSSSGTYNCLCSGENSQNTTASPESRRAWNSTPTDSAISPIITHRPSDSPRAAVSSVTIRMRRDSGAGAAGRGERRRERGRRPLSHEPPEGFGVSQTCRRKWGHVGAISPAVPKRGCRWRTGVRTPATRWCAR